MEYKVCLIVNEIENEWSEVVWNMMVSITFIIQWFISHIISSICFSNEENPFLFKLHLMQHDICNLLASYHFTFYTTNQIFNISFA
jgi:hypothetical protein